MKDIFRVKVKIQSWKDRESMVTALANAGYKVWVEERDSEEWIFNKNYYVCFEINDK